jgi:hypothetical protein
MFPTFHGVGIQSYAPDPVNTRGIAQATLATMEAPTWEEAEAKLRDHALETIPWVRPWVGRPDETWSEWATERLPLYRFL